MSNDDGMRRVITVQVGWLVLAVVLVLVALFVLAVRRPSSAPPAPVVGVDPAAVRAACAQYASLDLAGFAAVCAGAGYQQRIYVQPTGAPAWWPTVTRAGVIVQPEDLDRVPA